MSEDKMKYAVHIEESKKEWDKLTSKEKELFHEIIATAVNDFILLWDTLKAIEKKFNIDVMGIAREQIWKHSFAAGERLAKGFKEHGTKDLYDAYNSQFEGVAQAKWLECNDKVFHKWNLACPAIEHFKNLGKTDEEIKEMSEFFCLSDYGVMQGFNPELEVFPQSRLIMRGDSYCSYRTEDHRDE